MAILRNRDWKRSRDPFPIPVTYSTIYAMADYVTVSNGEEGEAALTVELPTEEDGTLLLSVLQSQFEGATGLKYK